MNCPFCGTTLAKVAAICPSCKIQLPEAQLFSYYAAALERDRSLAQPEKRAKLDSLVKVEAEAREKLLAEARERARIEEERAAAQRQKEAEEYRARQAVVAQEMKQKREEFFRENKKRISIFAVVASLVVISLIAASVFIKPETPKPFESESIRRDPCTALGIANRDLDKLFEITLDSNRENGLSKVDLTRIRNEAEAIQAALFEQTIGQANDSPQLEGAVLNMHTEIGKFASNLSDGMTETQLLTQSINPLKKISNQARKICDTAGLGSEYEEAKRGY